MCFLWVPFSAVFKGQQGKPKPFCWAPEYVLFSPVGFKGNLSLLDMSVLIMPRLKSLNGGHPAKTRL